MKFAATFLLGAAVLAAQSTVAPQDPAFTPTMLPKYIVTAGGGFASPNGKFAYISESSMVLPQQTYATVSQEYTLIKGQVQSCTFAGLTKPMYQFSVVTVGLTGLGGGCTSSSGETSGAGSAQGFLHIRWGKLPLGNVVTVMKNSNSGFKVTLGFSGSRQ